MIVPAVPEEYALDRLDALELWARGFIGHRPPNEIIGGNYMQRWHVIPHNPYRNVFLHLFLHGDDDRALHDHPADNESLILSGEYMEHTPEGVFYRKRGDVIKRPATAAHRIALIDNTEPVLTLFTVGPKIREWGFHCPDGWVHWTKFVNGDGCN